MVSTVSDPLIEEYKALREEILLHIKFERQILAISGTVFFVALAFLTQLSVELDRDLWGVILIGLMTPLFLLYRVEVMTIAKISSYIQKFIESKVEDLEWTGAHIEAIPKFGRGLFHWWLLDIGASRVIGFYFLILLSIAWALPWYLDGERPSWFALGIMLALSVLYIANFISLLFYRSFRARWEAIWEKSLRTRSNKSQN